MREIRKVYVCDICKKDITVSRIKWISRGARLRFYKRDRLGWPGEFREYDVCDKCFQKMMDYCQGRKVQNEKARDM